MITIFNRRQLLTTFSTKEQADARDRLAAAGLDYLCRCINRRSPSALSDTRARSGTFGEQPDLAYEYILYVKRADYDQAAALLAGTLDS